MDDWPTRILVGTDGSEEAALALRAAADIREKTGAELHVVHAWHTPGPASSTGRPLSTAYEQEARELLTAQVKRLEAAGKTVAEAHLRRGPPVDEILDLSEELDAGLIVAGRRGLSLLESFMMGSVSDGLVHHASRPVLIVSGGERAWPPRRIVIGEDLSEEATEAAKLAATLGRLFGADVHLVLATSKLPGVPSEARHRPDVPTIGEALRRSEQLLAYLSEELAEELGRRPQTEVVEGDAATVIVEAAQRGEEPVLIAVGSRNLGMIKRLILRSVSSDVLRAVSGPVLVYRRLADPRTTPELSRRASNRPRAG
jgi:nucleotide-binding universal stress UspA family protein